MVNCKIVNVMMEKKIYVNPGMDVVVLKAGQQMLTGSDPGYKNNPSSKPSYSRRYNGFEDEEDEDE